MPTRGLNEAKILSKENKNMAETATQSTTGENQANGTVTTSQEGQRSFTQEEVNSIVTDRLKRESAKYADYEELKAKASKLDEIEENSKSELQKATEKANSLQAKLDALTKANEIKAIRDKVATETGVPATLLSCETEEDCKAQAEAILKFANPGAYPVVKDGGEPQHLGKKTEAEQFADWFNASLK